MAMHQLVELLRRLQDGESLGPDEHLRLEQWADEADANRTLLTEIRSGLLPVQDLLFFKANEEQLDQKFRKLVVDYMEMPAPVKKNNRRITRFAAAATIALLLAGGVWYFGWQPTKVSDDKQKQLAVLDIPAGKQGAVLTLDDGSQVVLDSISGGVVARQGGTSITLQDGMLEYNPDKSAGQQILYNTMSTPKARQFQLMLPDGTRVWLNAASSVRFPVKFRADEREVSITGEVYFEVAKNESAPFRVRVSNRAVVDVLGTSFNVNAYDEEISATLLNGKVRVTSTNTTDQKELKPGQQALLAGDQLKLLNNVNTEKVMAWKNGVFNFEDITLESFMKEVERWYDVEVTISKGVPKLEFQGEMSRDISLKDLMSSLEKFGVRYRMEGKQLIILP